MKKILSALIFLMLIASAASVNVSAIGEELVAASGTPAIDGVVDGVWGMTQRSKFMHCNTGELSDGKLPGSSSAFVSALSDDEAIYFLIELNDNDYIFNAGDGEYTSDELRIYIDENDWFDTTWRYGQVCLSIIPDEENGRVEVIGDISESTTVAYSKESESRRYIEVKYVPTHYELKSEEPLLVDFRFNDVYENMSGDVTLAFGLTWSDELNEGDIDSSNWSYIKFGGAVAGEGCGSAEEAARSINQPLITGYEYVSGTGTYGYDGERARNMFDRDVGTKFCTPEMPASAVAKLDSKYLITGIIMATANDTASYSERNPADWKIEGSNDQKNWTVIAKGDRSFFQATNFTYYAQKLECDGNGYRFIRFTNKGNDNIMQLAEVNFCGIKSSAPQEDIDALLNGVEAEPVAVEDAIFLPISKSKAGGGSMEAIAAPTEPGEESTFNSDMIVTVIVITVSALLVAVCAVIAVLQSKQKRQNIL